MDIMIIIFETMSYVIMGYGVYVCWSAYRASKKKAWLLLCIFCFTPFFAFGVRTSIKAIFHEQYKRNQQETKIERRIQHKEYKVNFPIMDLLLVVALSFLAEEEIKRRKNQNEVASPNGETAIANSP